MPSKSKSQQRLFSMALAVRKGDLKRSEVHQSVLDIVDSKMTNKEIEEFTVLKENSCYVFIKFIIKNNNKKLKYFKRLKR